MAFFTRVVLVIMLAFQAQACTAFWDLFPKPTQEAKQSEPEVATEPEHIETVELLEGESLLESLELITVKDTRGREATMASKLNRNKNNIIAVVKPGCVYCESFLAVLKSAKSKIDANILYVLDAGHADLTQFKEKAKANKKAPGKWCYDIANKFHSVYGMNSFPRFLVLDKDANLVQHQKGLILPEDQAQLDGKDFAIVLQILSENTVLWLEQY